MPDNCWYKLILTKNDCMPDVSTVEQPSSAAYEQLHIRISNYKHYTQICIFTERNSSCIIRVTPAIFAWIQLPEEWRPAFIYLESCLQVHQAICTHICDIKAAESSNPKYVV